MKNKQKKEKMRNITLSKLGKFNNNIGFFYIYDFLIKYNFSETAKKSNNVTKDLLVNQVQTEYKLRKRKLIEVIPTNNNIP